jgi:hypothetical protein
MNRPLLIHHHIFKNAGTSFNHALQQYFGKCFFEFDLPNHQVVTSEHIKQFIQSHSQAQAISIHHACLPVKNQENTQFLSSILLRKPLARIKSIYQFERQQPAQTEEVIKAKILNFKDYVLWRLEATPTMFCNYQTYYCSRSRNHHRIPDQKALAIAIQNVQNCLIVGTVERYEESLRVAQFKLSQFYPNIRLIPSHLNITSKAIQSEAVVRAKLVVELGEEVVSQIEHQNQLDQQLYQVADEILNFNLLSIGPNQIAQAKS